MISLGVDLEFFFIGLIIQTLRVRNPTREHFLKFELTRSIRDQEQLGAGVVAIGISGD